MKEWIKRISLVLIGFSVTLGIMYVNSRGNSSSEVNSKQMAVFIEEDGKYKVSKTIPTKGYIFNEERSFCNNGATPTWNSLTNGLKISNLTKDKTSCMLYFDKNKNKTSYEMLASLGREENTEEVDFSSIDEKEHLDSTGKTQMFKAEDDFGDSYYFRGKVEDNWVKFGKDKDQKDIYWRIIRINGDGTIRLIYTKTIKEDGTTPESTESQTNEVTSQSFNETRSDNKYVGYQFDDTGTDKRGHTSPSNAYTQLKQWFSENLSEEWNGGNGKIDSNTGFCGDRSSSTSSSASWLKESLPGGESGGTGTTPTYYGAYLRLTRSNRMPTLKCSTKGNEDKDYYTYTGAKETDASDGTKIKGTQSLEYPIGLITADEVAFAGGYHGSNNTNYWLYTGSGSDNWTMSPFYFNINTNYAYVFTVNSHGNLSYHSVTSVDGLRPVINLKSSVEFTGSGTTDDPYIIK